MPRAVTEKRAPVIKDVASLAGVSVSSVSRYLNGSSHLSDEGRERIEHAIKLLDYRPSRVARGLAKSSMKSVAVLTSDTTLYGDATTIQGVEDEARSNGYPVSIAKLEGDSANELKNAVDTVIDQRPRGVVVLNYDEVARKSLALLPEDLPRVLIAGDRVPGSTQISLCEAEAGALVTDYLLDAGHRVVHHVAVPNFGGGYSRTAGWESALRKRGVPIPDPIDTTWNPRDAIAIGHDLVRRGDVTAVFAGNDEIAMGLIRGILEEGGSVPGDIAVVGFDDNPIAAVSWPSLTTVREDFYRAGRVAMQLLLAQMQPGFQLEPSYELGTLIPIEGTFIKRESA